MKEYSVVITVTVPIQARNQEQAEERAQVLQDALGVKLDRRSKWVDLWGVEYDAEVWEA